MKKCLLAVFLSLIFSSFAFPKKGRIEAYGAYFSPVFDQAFQEIYGGGLAFGLDLNVNIRRNFGIWFGGRSFSQSGQLTFTKEDTQLSLVSFAIGTNWIFVTPAINFYAALGARLLFYKESNVLGEAKDTGIGVEAKAGMHKVFLAGFFVDFFVGCSYNKMQPADFKINVGGIETGIGIGYEF